MNSESWLQILHVLDVCAGQGRRLPFWWRDDDAARPTPELRRLLDLRRQTGIPLALAVIPAEAGADLADALAGDTNIAVLQHGFSHVNHANSGEKKSEFPAHRASADAIASLKLGRQRLQDLFGRALRPVLVPPWNRISPNLLPHLPRLGLHGLSAYRTRSDPWAAPGLMQVNTHLDPINWKDGAGFIGEYAALAPIAAHLQAFDVHQEPVGLLTHHARHDAPGWAFLADFITAIAGHPGAVWVDVDQAFGAGPGPAR